MSGPFDHRVAVVVVNWNRCKLLLAALTSLSRQRGLTPEIIVVDNGSTDGSCAAVRDFTRASLPQGWKLTLIENTENRGFCAANNQGIFASSAEFVALLNNDAEAEPEWLWELLRMFEDRPDVGMAASKILVWEEPGRIDKAGHLMYPDGQNRGRGTGELDRGQYDQVEEVLWPDGCAAMYRRAMLDEVGGFDEDFFAYADDAELGLRARIAGWRCMYNPRAVVRHHRGATLGTGSVRRLELIERNRILLVAKLFPGNLLWRNIGYYAMRIGAGTWAALRRKGEARRYPGAAGKLKIGWALLKGNLGALPLLPRMLRKRRRLQAIRRLTGPEVSALLMRHRISLKAISEQAT
ncbi:MAG: glycosyltransferase family 2 protein [Bryobacteraceae bacterium]|nr:glycosyltransferase family 2 protein [Bryobacteraceae bacterium]